MQHMIIQVLDTSILVPLVLLHALYILIIRSISVPRISMLIIPTLALALCWSCWRLLFSYYYTYKHFLLVTALDVL